MVSHPGSADSMGRPGIVAPTNTNDRDYPPPPQSFSLKPKEGATSKRVLCKVQSR